MLGFVVETLAFEDFGELAVNFGLLRAEAGGFAEVGGGLGEVAAVGEGDGDVVVGLERGGIDAEGLGVGGDGLVPTGLFEEQVAEVDLDAGIVGGEARGGGVMREGFVVAIVLGEEIGEIVVGGWRWTGSRRRACS